MLRGLLLSIVSAPALAQAVHSVGPGGFAQITDAIVAAAPGDVIEVRTGAYTPFRLYKPLTIRAAPGASVAVLPFNTDPVVIDPPPGSATVIAGIDFLNPWWFYRRETRVDGGTVWFEDCGFQAPEQIFQPALAVSDATVVMRGCVLIGAGVLTGTAGTANPGLVCVDGTVLATDCTFIGSNTVWDSYGNGGPGITATNSDLQLVRCMVLGGDQLHPFANPPGVGLLTAGPAQTVNRLWLSDCFVEGGSSPQTGAAGVQHGGPVPMQFARTTMLGGIGQGGIRGPAVLGLNTGAPLLGLDAAAPRLVRGSQFALHFRTEPNWPVAVVLATDLAPQALPQVAQPFVVPAASSSVLALLFADATGAASYVTTVPAGPAMLHVRLFVAGFAGLTLPLQTAPPVGGLIW